MNQGGVRLLANLDVLDLSGANAALAGRLLAEQGARVIRPEPPTGDPMRLEGPWAGGIPGSERSLRFVALNSGKLSVELDPELPEARGTLRALAEACDATLLSDTSAWYGMVDVDAIAASGRPVVVVHGFMPGGPYADYAAPESVTMALGGLLYISGDRGQPPCLPPEPLSHYFASVWASLALVSGIRAARQGGSAAVYRVSVHEAMATQEHLVRAAAMEGTSIARNGSQHKSVAPATVYPTSDGYAYIYVSRNHWEPFKRAWDGHDAEWDDPRYLPNGARRKEAKRLNAAVTSWTANQTTRALVATLQAQGVPCLPVNRPSDFAADDQVVARELFGTVTHPVLGSYRQMRFPATVDGERAPATRPPLHGEHTEVLAEVLGKAAGGPRA